MLKKMFVILSLLLILVTLVVSGPYNRCEAGEINKDKDEVSHNMKGLGIFKKGLL